MLNLLIYLIVSLGCSCLWSLSEIFQPSRNFVAKYFPALFRKMLLCMECSSFWVGLFISLFIFPFPLLEVSPNFIINSICGGVSTYFFVKILINTKILNIH
jgi:hypothetical protein